MASVLVPSSLPHFSQDSKTLLYAAVLLILAVVILLRTRTPRCRASTPTPPSPESEKKAERAWGTWPPSPFTRPRAPPYPSWSLHTTLPLPYRPFRYGPKYAINMGLRPMHWADWIELDSHFPKFHAEKRRRITERGPKCSRTAPEALDAAQELLHELTAYLAERYPELYAWEGGEQRVLVNRWSGERCELDARAEDPMQMCGRLVQDDLALMVERADGQYYLLAGSVLLAGFWRLEDKFGMPLSEIHTSGEVPGYREKLEKGMMNFFRRLKPESPMVRNNYFIQVDDQLGWSTSIGPEDDAVGWDSAEAGKPIENIYFRSERQSLRRLPRTGAVVFTIRTYFEPVTAIAQEKHVPGRLASAVRSWGDDVSKYKGKGKYDGVLLEYLDRKHAEQVEQGLEVDKEGEGGGYPY